MTFTPIIKGTPNWDSPLNLALTQLDNSISSGVGGALKAVNNLSDLTNVPTARANLNLTGLANAQSNLTATTNPTVSSDNTQGYSIGSTWCNTTTNALFVCVNTSTGAAIWNQVPSLPVTIAQGGTGSTTKNFVDLTTGQTVAGSKVFSNNVSMSANAQIGTTGLGDNGAVEIQLANATTVPTTNPTGGVLVYSNTGRASYRNPQGLVGTVSSGVQAQTSTVTIANTASLSTLETFTVPANDPVAGSVYEVTGYGTFSVTATPTLTFALYWGGTGGTVIAAVPAITATSGITSAPFSFRALVIFRSTTSCTAMINLSVVTATATATTSSFVASPTALTTVTTTANSALTMGFTWSAASASNTISLLGGDVRKIS